MLPVYPVFSNEKVKGKTKNGKVKNGVKRPMYSHNCYEIRLGAISQIEAPSKQPKQLIPTTQHSFSNEKVKGKTKNGKVKNGVKRPMYSHNCYEIRLGAISQIEAPSKQPKQLIPTTQHSFSNEKVKGKTKNGKVKNGVKRPMYSHNCYEIRLGAISQIEAPSKQPKQLIPTTQHKRCYIKLKKTKVAKI